MNDLASILFGALGGSVAALAALKLLTDWLVRHQLAKALQDHEARLSQKTDLLKTQLSIYAHEQTISLTRVDAQRAKALHDIYSAIRKWASPATTLVAGSPLRNVENARHIALYARLCEEAHRAASNLYQVLGDNAIYVDSDLYTQLADLSTTCGLAVAEVLVPIRQGTAEGWSPDRIHAETERQRASFAAKYKEQIQPTLQSVTLAFRRTLGVERPSAA